MKKLILIIIVLVAVGAGVAGFYMRRGTPEPEVRTAPITRGDIVDSVQASTARRIELSVDDGLPEISVDPDNRGVVPYALA